ncbi:MAG TPA: hypothetical protein VN894_17035 [Polyangiaceae bacterium]|nr:hypothetical protein [Polyangiaceae bacterium]
MRHLLFRRDVLMRSAAFGALGAFGTAACGKEKHAALACNDTSGLSAADVQLRATLAYADISVEAGKSCARCLQYLPAPTADACGACKILKGPVNPKGSCKSFVLKPA